jgi:hypothetical protein
LLEAIIQFMRSPSTGFRSFIGEVVCGNESAYGPYLGIAPEGTECPYMVYDVLENEMDQGFSDMGKEGTCYGEKPVIRFHLYDTDTDNLAANLTKFVNTMDTILDFDLPDGQLCESVLRVQNPLLMAEPVGKKGLRVYHSVVTYEYRNSRQIGVGS